MDKNENNQQNQQYEEHKSYLEEYYVIMATMIELFFDRLWNRIKFHIQNCNYMTRKCFFENINSDPQLKDILINVLWKEVFITLDEYSELENAQILCSNATYYTDKTPIEMFKFLQTPISTPFCFYKAKSILLNISPFILNA